MDTGIQSSFQQSHDVVMGVAQAFRNHGRQALED
jgi:hypothetical protein